MPPPPRGRVARARIIPPGQLDLFQTAADQVLDALKPGLREERYGRLWRVGQTSVRDGLVYGHLGFQKQVDADLWDDRSQDFTPTAVASGMAAPFALRLADLVVVFQVRRDIRVMSFTGALRSVLRNATAVEWDVRSLTGETRFSDWRQTVDLVTRVRFRFEDKPTLPSGVSGLLHLLRQASSELATLDLRSRAGVDSDSPLIKELLGYTENGQGELTAAGRRTDAGDAERVWASSLGGETVLNEVPVDATTREADHQALLDQIRQVEVT
ncbi:hypothetical protein O7600_16475 [Micromonospora sp. WMMA1998]|uniref:hypothetical protein n=1 Tax=Micromonospora sp. WMMA1998 TaxID=3015167 RepID=UPI00248B957E|nr:hypothetical protein [Micromonospora sp. WMMA1998]WBC12779.1 hypothetical protein O7600_16475 [Micromonospora sp. WMMA1998]